MKPFDKSPAVAPYPLNEQERESLIFRLENTGRPDAEMAEAYGDGNRQRSNDGRPHDNRQRPRDRDFGPDSRGPRGQDRGPRSDNRRDPSREVGQAPRDAAPEAVETPTQPEVATQEVVNQEAVSEQASPTTITQPSPTGEPTADDFGAGVVS